LTDIQDPLFDLPADQTVAPSTELQILAALQETRRGNAALYDELVAGQRRPDPIGVLLLKLDTLIELALPAADRNQLELVFEQRMTGALENCLREMRQEKLTQGVTAPATSLIVPGR
jgi:hypothetical protein